MKRNRITVAIILCLFASVPGITIAMGQNGGRKQATMVFTEFLEASSAGRFTEAYDLLGFATKSIIDYEQFSEWRTLSNSMYRLDKFSVWYRTKPVNYGKALKNYRIGDVAYSQVYIATANLVVTDLTTGVSYTQVIDRFIAKEEDAWKLLARTGPVDEITDSLSRSAKSYEEIGTTEHLIVPETIAESGSATLHSVAGMPFLRLSGTYYEMGYQYGVLLGDRISAAFESLESERESLMASLSPKLLSNMADLLGPRYSEQLKGMADGSGIDIETLLIASWYGELRRRSDCTSVLSDTAGGFLHGRNLDDIPFSGANLLIVEYNPNDGRRSVSLSVLGILGISEGMNDSGITVSGNGAPGNMKNDALLGLPYNLIRRELLDSSSSILEAKEILSNYMSTTGAIIAVGSGDERKGIISEHSYRKHATLESIPGGTIYATNNYSSSSMPGSKASAVCGRYQQISDFAERNEVTGIEDLIYILSLPSSPFGVNNRNTVRSVVFDSASRTLYFAHAEGFAAGADWYRYDWVNNLWFLYRSGRPLELYM
jgi:hypothetical protein